MPTVLAVRTKSWGRGIGLSSFLSGLLVHLAGSAVCAETIVRWNFTRGLQGWKGNQFVEDLTFSHDGLSLEEHPP